MKNKFLQTLVLTAALVVPTVGAHAMTSPEPEVKLGLGILTLDDTGHATFTFKGNKSPLTSEEAQAWFAKTVKYYRKQVKQGTNLLKEAETALDTAKKEQTDSSALEALKERVTSRKWALNQNQGYLTTLAKAQEQAAQSSTSTKSGGSKKKK